MGRIKKYYSLKVFFVLFFSFNLIYTCFAEEGDHFQLCAWAVGQFAEYRISSMDSESTDNRYRFEIFKREYINGQEYFGIELNLSNKNKKEIGFKALVQPMCDEDFSRDPAKYISQGMLFLLKNSDRKLISKSTLYPAG